MQNASAYPMNPVGTPTAPPSAEPHAAPTMNVFEEEKRGLGLSGVILVLLSALLLAYGGWLFLQGRSINSEINRVQTSIFELNDGMKKIQEKTNVSDQIAAADILSRLSDKQKKWSTLMDEIMKLQNAEVSFNNISANRDKRIFVTGKSQTYGAVAGLIDDLQDTPVIGGEFVESVVESRAPVLRGRDSSAAKSEGVQFQLIFDYLPQ